MTKHLRRAPLLVALCAAGALLTGCSLAPELTVPELTMPGSWDTDTPQTSASKEELDVQWWKRFNDPCLNALIDEAFRYNKDMTAALARIDAARARFGSAQSERLPLVSGNAVGNPTYVDGAKTSTSQYAATFNASWELDLWGKYRNLSEAARAEFLATEAALEGTRLSLAGQVAASYFHLRTLEVRKRTAERTLDTRVAFLAINKERYRHGLISELDLTQSQSVVETARTALYRTNALIEASLGSLAVLLGRQPLEIMNFQLPAGKKIEELPPLPVIPAGLPGSLLARRPDIIQAMQNLVAANARVGVARAAWLPNISLTGLFGVVSLQLGDLFGSKNHDIKGLEGTASMPLLDFGRVYYAMKAADASLNEAYATYEKAVLVAFSDMRSALASQTESGKVVESLTRQVTQYKKAYELALLRYDNGYCSYLDVLDAERSLFQAELDLADAYGERYTSIVQVCLALGGGWRTPEAAGVGQTAPLTETGLRPGATADSRPLAGN